jgi:hypothetical protein
LESQFAQLDQLEFRLNNVRHFFFLFKFTSFIYRTLVFSPPGWYDLSL